MSNSTTNSGVVTKRATPPQRKPRPISIAVTGVSKEGNRLRNYIKLMGFIFNLHYSFVEKPPLPKAIKRTPSAGATRTAPSSASETPKRQSSARATPKASTTPAILSPSAESAHKTLQQSITVTKEISIDEKSKTEKTIINNVIKAEQKHNEENLISNGTASPDVVETKEFVQQVLDKALNTVTDGAAIVEVKLGSQEIKPEVIVAPVVEKTTARKEKETPSKPAATPNKHNLDTSESIDMSASMIAKSRITTEEEAKAAITERRRLAREEAERQAELERQRMEAEDEAEHQRQLQEEANQRKLEEDTNRLAAEQKILEGERLQQAIEENLKREENEKLKREEEARQKVEREEAERKAREDAEKQKEENAERLRKEEKDREERRKRVEAIMARTRAKGAANTPSKVILKYTIEVCCILIFYIHF